MEVSKYDKEDQNKTEAYFGDAVKPCCNNRCNKVFPKDLIVKHRYVRNSFLIVRKMWLRPSLTLVFV